MDTIQGPITRMPQSPRTTLGTDASISTSAPTGPRSQGGASSVRKSAIAIEIGPAIRSAKSEVSAVPKMKAAAPNWLVTGFQVSVREEAEPELLDRRPGAREHLDA